MKLYKLLIEGAIKDEETVGMLRERMEALIGEGAKVIVCDRGMDIKPVEQEYYGLYRPEAEEWICDKDGNLKYYPHKSIAQAEAMYVEGVETRSFNGIEDVRHA